MLRPVEVVKNQSVLATMKKICVGLSKCITNDIGWPCVVCQPCAKGRLYIYATQVQQVTETVSGQQANVGRGEQRSQDHTGQNWGRWPPNLCFSLVCRRQCIERLLSSSLLLNNLLSIYYLLLNRKCVVNLFDFLFSLCCQFTSVHTGKFFDREKHYTDF